ncbi:CD225/dispanin family protein [Salinimicrobium sp. HB62]|uniref:CD225/dispanin family protein n=1 Tax=Salinimicrobium sp. HB62 TaxID=3077781 RepID=UPI002D78EE48|nr:CD225/dispanin family protein [Salinimicrobium sp. HB62]
MTQYYYSDGLEKHGPFSLEELKAKRLNRKTLVWHHPREKWIPASDYPELADTLSEDPPPTEPGAFTSSSRADSYAEDRKLPRTWLVESILVTLFCCLPFGIVGIVNAARVETRYSCGDFEGAVRSSKEAGKWTQIGFWIGVAVIVIYAVVMVFAIALDS